METRDSSNFLSYQKWIGLPEITRVRIAGLFQIPRTGEREVFGNQVVKDGYSVASLGSITTEGMQQILGSKSNNFYELFDSLCEFVNRPQEQAVAPELKVEINNIMPIEAVEPLNVQQEKPKEVIAGGKGKAGRKPKVKG